MRWSPARWSAIKTLFGELFELPEAERAVQLAARAGDDAELAAAVETLLAHSTTGRLERGALSYLPGFGATEALPPLPAPGSRCGPFELIRQVGVGGMGAVFEAVRREGTGLARVAVKVLHPSRPHEVLARHFVSEQRYLQAVDHPGVARFVDAGQLDDGRPWYAMTFVDGGPIDQWCRATRASPARRVALVREVALIIQHTRDHGVLHRDLKLSNILVTPDGSPAVVDFGIARWLDDDDPGTLTRAGFRPMSLHYASPEHRAGKPLTAAADVWSLGAVLFTLLTGQVPDSRVQAPSSVLDPSLVPDLGLTGLEEAREAVACFDACTTTALARDPLQRYPTARVFAAALARALATSGA